MGLTFEQKLYTIPKVYFIKTLEPGDAADSAETYGIVEKPDFKNKDEELDFNLLFESQGYYLLEYDLSDLNKEGYRILRECVEEGE